MTAAAKQVIPKRHLLLASDRGDDSSELARILRSVGDVDTMRTTEIPENPEGRFSGVIVDINLRSPESVQPVRNKLRSEAYREMPRLFVLQDALHHATMPAWALGATDTISRPFDAVGLLQRIRAAFPDSDGYDETDRGKALNRGVEAAHAVIRKIFTRLPAGSPLTFEDLLEAENKILKAIKHSSLREWLTTVGCHHAGSYRHCLFVTGFAVAFAQHLGMREDDQRRLTRAALLHDVGKAFIPLPVLNKPGKLTDEEFALMRKHPARGWALLRRKGDLHEAVLDAVLHHHEKIDGSGYPDKLAGEQISLIAKMAAICDVYDAITSNRPYKNGWDPSESLRRMAEWTRDHFDAKLFQAFVKSIGIYPVGSLVRLASGRIGVVTQQSGKSLLMPCVKVFFSTKSDLRIPPEVIDLSAPGCSEKIVAREDPAQWNFPDLNELWSGQSGQPG